VGQFSISANICIRDEQIKDADAFHVYGYPDEGRGYEYDKKTLTAELWCVSGRLTKPAAPGLHTVRVVGRRPVKFRGMSGSMVIAEKNGEWKFGGMVTLASDLEGFLSFIPAEQIVYYLDKMLLMEMMGLVLPADPEATC
jgi:hypothetical protein